MNTLILVFAVLVIALLIAILFLNTQKSPKSFPYQISKPLLTKAERSFYEVLSHAVGHDGVISAKVRVADVITTQKGLSNSQRQRAFNLISSKHFDFVICNPNDFSVKFAVELDDSSHNKRNQIKRDHFVNEACKASRLPLLRVKASKGYVVEDLKTQISLLFELPVEQESTTGENFGNESLAQSSPQIETTLPNSENDTKGKLCPKCGASMVVRKAKSGKHAGKKFWGCSEFPKCKCAVQLDV